MIWYGFKIVCDKKKFVFVVGVECDENWYIYFFKMFINLIVDNVMFRYCWVNYDF